MRSTIPQVPHHDYISSQPFLKSYSPFFNSSNQINITISTKMDKMESRGEVHEPLLRSIPDPEPISHYHELDFQAWKCRHQLRLLQAPRLASWIELKILLRLAAPAVLVYLINNPCPCPPESSLATSAILSLLLPLLAMWCPILSLWPHGNIDNKMT